MLIDGLMRERGVSVFYGDFDEFKTTLVLDMMAHVAGSVRMVVSLCQTTAGISSSFPPTLIICGGLGPS